MHGERKILILMALGLGIAGVTLGTILWLWPSGEPRDKLRIGMTFDEVETVMGKCPLGMHGSEAHEENIGWGYTGGHDLSELFSRQSPYIHPVNYWRSQGWTVFLTFSFTGSGPWRLADIQHEPPGH